MECNCLRAKYLFNVQKRLPPKWYNKNRFEYPSIRKFFTIHGDSYEDIQKRKEQMREELYSEYPKEQYLIEVYDCE